MAEIHNETLTCQIWCEMVGGVRGRGGLAKARLLTARELHVYETLDFQLCIFFFLGLCVGEYVNWLWLDLCVCFMLLCMKITGINQMTPVNAVIHLWRTL